MSGHLRVLESVRKDTSNVNPFVPLLLDSLAHHMVVYDFSWRRALLRPCSYDVFHVHWPEYLVRGALRPARFVAALSLLLLCSARRIPVVWTVHNTAPHESGNWFDRAFFAFFRRSVSACIFLNRADMAEIDRLRTRAVTAVIPHGHYRTWFRDAAPRRANAETLLFFGLLRPYKGIEDLISAFSGLTDRPQARLKIVGKMVSGDYGRVLIEACKSDPRITLRTEAISDEELAIAISEATLVVLPYRRLHNSGALLLALSLGCPVLATDSAASREIQAEVGTQWLRLTSRPLLPATLLDALAWAESPRLSLPSFDKREWATEIAPRYAEVFASVLASARPKSCHSVGRGQKLGPN